MSAEAPGEEAVDERRDSVTFDIFYNPLTLPAELAVGPNLGFFTVKGANEILTDTLDVSNLGDGALGWTAGSDAPTTVVVSVDTTGLTEPSLPPVLVDYFINVEAAPAAPITYTLTITKAGNGSGTVTSNPAGINCGSSCSAAFTASTVNTLTPPAANSTFSGWSGACTGSPTCQVTMDAAKSVTATFTSVQSGNDGKLYLPLIRK